VSGGKTEISAEKGQRKKVNLGWHRDRKESPISAPSIHVGALVHSGPFSLGFAVWKVAVWVGSLEEDDPSQGHSQPNGDPEPQEYLRSTRTSMHIKDSYFLGDHENI
jgi:hypothetical protein